MRLVHVTPFYPPIIGGVEKVAVNIAEYMALEGAEVHVVTYNRLRTGGANSLPREEVINGVHVLRLRPSFAWDHGTYSRDFPEALIGLRPDIVHTHAWRHPHVFQVAKVKKKIDCKTILHGHAPFHDFSQLGLPVWLYHRLIDQLKKDVLEDYDSLIALTPHEKEILTTKLGCHGEKIVVIPNGIEDQLMNRTSTVVGGDPMLFYLGRVCKSKNVDFLLKASRFVTKGTSDFTLLLAGPDESLVENLRSYAKRHGICFQYAGIVSEMEKLRLYGSCAAFVHPAIYEPFGITLLEAQAFGKPCVITGNGGQLYVAPPGKTSLHTRPDPKAYGEAISLLLNDAELHRKLSVNAKAWASEHIWSRVLPKFKEAYDHL